MNNQSKKEKLPSSAAEPVEPEELAHYDDTVIGRALRWSITALILIAIGIGTSLYLLNRKGKKPPSQVTQLTAPAARERPRAQLPLAKFSDITAASGITFVHNNGAYGDKLLPESMGGGVAFVDFDNNGTEDLLFVNSSDWPDHLLQGKKASTMALYKNDGKGHFTDVTAGSGLDVSFYGMGVAVGDYDNDDLPDVFISAVGSNHLFHNQGNGKFIDVTWKAGVGGSPTQWSTSGAWIDYDNDGRLDLFVCNYIRWSKEIDFEVGYKLVGIGRAYGPPMNFEGAFPYLYHNDGEGHFTDVSQRSGIQITNPATGVPAPKSLGVAPVDLDEDGWIDLVIANDTVQNYVFHNQRTGTFKEISAVSGIAYDSYGNIRGAMGIDAARYRNDKTLGVAIGNFANEMTALYVSSERDPTNFTDESIPEGVGPASRLLLKFGIFFFDYDLDGYLDLLTANGHIEEEINKVQKSQTYAQPAQLFWNSGGSQAAGFIPVPPEKCGPDIFRPIVGRGSAFADIDGDGDLDVVLTQIGGPPLLLRNDQALNHHWLRVKLVGKKNNRDAIGAWVRVRPNNHILARQVMPTRSYLSQSELPVTIGLGEAKEIGEVEVVWPGGAIQKVQGLVVDQLNRVEEAQ